MYQVIKQSKAQQDDARRLYLKRGAQAVHRQRGMSLLPMLALFLIGGLFVTCILKMGPVYLQNWNLNTIMNEVHTQFTPAESVSKAAIKSKIGRRMNIDMIDAIKVEDIAIERDGDEFVITADYESRVPLLGNVDVVMKFNNRASIPIK